MCDSLIGLMTTDQAVKNELSEYIILKIRSTYNFLDFLLYMFLNFCVTLSKMPTKVTCFANEKVCCKIYHIFLLETKFWFTLLNKLTGFYFISFWIIFQSTKLSSFVLSQFTYLLFPRQNFLQLSFLRIIFPVI